MIRVYLLSLNSHLVAFLELSLLKHKQRPVKARFKQEIGYLRCLQVVILGLVDIAASQFKHSEVVIRLGMVRVMTD